MKSKLTSSLLLVLLCLGAFHFNQVQAACDSSVSTQCATCDDAATTKCLTCKDHYVYYSDSQSCSPCSTTNYYLPTGKTLDSECVPGPDNCWMIYADGTCKTCDDQYILSADAKTCGGCSDPTKYLPKGKLIDTECVAGPANCAQTNIVGTCKTCADHYILSDDAKTCGTCSVATKYLPTGKTKDSECIDGPANCKTLNVDGTCKTCNDQYVLSDDGKTCGACSDATKYLPIGKTKDSECVAGPANCAQTNLVGTCKTCADHYILSADFKTCGTCSVATKYLPTGKTTDDQCIDGPANCKTLNVDGTCKTCATNYVLSDDAKTCGACSDSSKYLPSGKTKDSDCVACTANCRTCSVPGVCGACADGYYLDATTKTCKACDTGCAKCTGTGADKCTTCSTKYFADTSSKLCKACDTGCDTCSGNGADKCSQCSAYYYVDTTSKVCQTCPTGKYLPAGKTLSTDCTACADGKYMKEGGTTLEECLACDAGCAKCTGTGSGKCTTCSAQFYLDDTCKSCGDGKYLPNGKSTAADCATCDTGCAKCTGTGNGQCTTCSTNYYLDGICKTCNDKNKYFPANGKIADDCVECAYKCTECNVDGTCKTCETGRYVKDGKCTPCSKGCTTCGSDGKCTVCADGYYLSSGACVACTTGCTKCDSATKCTACDATAYYLSSDACKTCSTGCTACGSGGKCTACASGYYYDDVKGTCSACTGSACTTCGADLKCTKCSSGYVLDSKAACTTCPTGCTECSTDGTCTKCDYNYSFLKNACTACPTGTYVGAGTELAASCTACTSGQYYSETEHKCKDCFKKDTSNCKACSGPNIGQCALCNDNFNLVSGTCVSKDTEVKARTGSASAKIRFDMDLDNYNSNGGANFFAAQVADSLKVSIDQVQVTGTQIGSVIVLFTVFSTGATTPADLTQQINNALAQGNLNVYGNSVVVMDSNAVVLLPNGCPSGQYYDSATYACKDCTDDICGEKKSKVGAIVGGVLGGLAFIVIIAVLIWKKDVIFGKMKSNKVVSAEYNGLNTMSPTATAFKTESA